MYFCTLEILLSVISPQCTMFINKCFQYASSPEPGSPCGHLGKGQTKESDPKSTADNAKSPASPIGNFSAALSWQLEGKPALVTNT